MTTTDCASCADERAAGAAFCEACGNPLETARTDTRTEARLTETDSNDPKSCPHCGTSGSVGADGYCENCGLLAARPRDHTEIGLAGDAAAVTDRGQRHHRNEDAMWLSGGPGRIDAVVCDAETPSLTTASMWPAPPDSHIASSLRWWRCPRSVTAAAWSSSISMWSRGRAASMPQFSQ